MSSPFKNKFPNLYNTEKRIYIFHPYEKTLTADEEIALTYHPIFKPVPPKVYDLTVFYHPNSV